MKVVGKRTLSKLSELEAGAAEVLPYGRRHPRELRLIVSPRSPVQQPLRRFFGSRRALPYRVDAGSKFICAVLDWHFEGRWGMGYEKQNERG